MKPRSFLVLLVLAAIAAPARAQQSDDSKPLPVLHVSDAHRSCFFDLHPELTQDEFRQFAEQLGSILRFRQLGDTATLGKGTFDISLQFTRTPIDQTTGAWNNTMSHPAPDHYLGTAISIPRVVARYGLSDRVDLGGWGGFNPDANYGMAGVDTKIALVRQVDGRPVSVSIRPSVTFLIGPSEVLAGNASIDLAVGRSFGPLSPYVGIAASSSAAVERSADVDLRPATAGDGVAYAGVTYRWRTLRVSGEVEKGNLVSYGFRIGTRF